MTQEVPTQPNLKSIHTWLATWFGFGFMRPAPGTWGSLGALPFGIILFEASNIWVFMVAIIVVTLVGFKAAAAFSADTQSHDNGMIVIDEVVGQWIALLPVFWLVGVNALLILCAFGLFRLFDITKPWPVSYCDREMKGAWGVMLDDVVAGFFAAGCMLGLIYGGFG